MRPIWLIAVLSAAAAAQTATTLSISPNPAGVGQPTTFTATVNPGSGFVAFMEGNKVLATAPIQGGQAIARHRFPLPGVHSVRAVHSGTTSSSVAVTVPSTAPVSFGHRKTIFNERFVLGGKWHFLDINRDGIEDAVFLNGTESQVLTALGTGNPAKPMSDYIVTPLPNLLNLRLGDVSGDGIIDLAVNLGGSIDFWLGDGSGRFVPSSMKIAGSQTLFNALEANGDGVPDFVVSIANPRATAIWLSAGSGAWSLATIHLWNGDPNTDSAGEALEATGDFNGDGRTDFIVQTHSQGCKVVLASGAGVYTPTSDWFDCGGKASFFHRHIAEDVNGDGRADLLYPSGDSGPNAWNLRLASASGTMGSAISIPLIAGATREDLIGVADWDLDGNKDILSVAFYTPPVGSSDLPRSWVRIRKGNGAGQFTHAADYVTFVGEPQFDGRYHLADWNGDGLVDLVTSDRSAVGWQIGLLNVPPQTGVIFIPGPDVIVGRPHVFQVSTSDGNGDLRYVRVVFGKAPAESGGCAFDVDVKNRTIRMEGSNQGAVSWPAVLQNSFCAIDVTASSTGEVSGRITAFAPLAGINKIYVRATDEIGLQSGWGEGFPVNVVYSPPVLPTFLAVSPQAGSPFFQTLTVTLHDPNGAEEIRDVLLLVNGTVNGARACLIHFDVKDRKVELFNDSGTGHLPPGNGQTANAQCTIRQSSATISPTLTGLTLSVPVAFASGFHGDHRLFVNAVETSGASTGWLDRAAFSVRTRNAAGGPGTRSLLPEYWSSDYPVTAEFTHSDPAQHFIGYIFVMQVPSPVAFSAAKACILEYNRFSHSIRMINDAGTGWSEPKTAGTMAGVVANSQCIVDAASVAANISGEVMTVRATIALRPGYTGPGATFLQALDASGRYSGVRQFGVWNSLFTHERRSGPFLPFIAQGSTGSGSETAVSFSFGPTGSIEWATVLISDEIGNPGCQIYYFPKTGLLRLVSEDGTALLSPPVVVHSRCSLDARAPVITSLGEDGLRVSVNVKFNPATFSGRKTFYSLALSSDGWVTHWQPGRTFDVQ